MTGPAAKQPRIVGVVQARIASTRLPGKVMREILGRPMLARVMDRSGRARLVDELAVATSSNRRDDPIAELCSLEGWPCFRGNETDVLDRYYQAAHAFRSDVLIRLSGDNPLIDPELIDLLIQAFLARYPTIDYAANVFPSSGFPIGLAVEVVSRHALERAWREDVNPYWREHVTPYIYRHPEAFHLHLVTNDTDYSKMRWTVDTPEDLILATKIYEHFGHDHFSWREIVQVLGDHPDWIEINAAIRQQLVP